jgi:protein arginine N-methyltransferase 3
VCARGCRDVLNHEIEHESTDACLDHCASAYGWDLRALAAALQLDIYGSIRLVNYLRKEVIAQRAALDDAALVKHLQLPFVDGARPALLDDDALLFPVVEDDALLPVLSQESFDGPDGEGVAAAADSVASLQLENELLRNQLIAQSALLEDAKTSLCATVEDGPDAHSSGSEDDAEPAAQSGGGARAGASKRRGGKPRNYEANEKHYFDSYAKMSIHHEMLSDHTRTESYRLFLQENPSLIKDKIVLDGSVPPCSPSQLPPHPLPPPRTPRVLGRMRWCRRR